MGAVGFTFLLVASALLLSVPRRFAAIPLVAGAIYITPAQALLIGPFHFSVFRLLILAGFIRVAFRGEARRFRFTGIDKSMLLWGVCVLLSSFFHSSVGEALVFRLGLAYTTLGFYFLVRLFCRDEPDFVRTVAITAGLIIPIALEMMSEKATGTNSFAFLGGVPFEASVRGGSIRAQGPFAHSILAGTVGAILLPLFIGIWARHRLLAIVASASALAMVAASASSGPIMSLGFGLFAVALWRWQKTVRYLKIAAVCIYAACEVMMTRPAYYLLEKIDLTGGSTGYHRAALIHSALRHLDEWWLAGTDYTRHWMPYGLAVDPNHCDITNQYLLYGVIAGLPLLLIFIYTLFLSFRSVSRYVTSRGNVGSDAFFAWCLGASLFAQAVTSISVAYFDQSVIFLFLNIAFAASLAKTDNVSPHAAPGTAIAPAHEQRQTPLVPPPSYLR